MSILKIIEILCSSEISWEDAARKGIAKASKSVKHIGPSMTKAQPSVMVK